MTAGSFCSGFLAYALCRRFGQKAVDTLLSKDEQTQGHQLFHDYGGWILALSKWLPLLPELVACMAGFFHMSARSVDLAILVGSAPMALTFAWVGHLGEGNPTRPLLISALTPPILWWWIGRRLTRIYGTERKSTLDRKAKCARKLIKKKGKSEPQKVEPHVNGRLRPDFLAT